MENILNNILAFLNSSSIAVWLIPLLIIILVVIISKGKDILDFANIQKDDLSYTFAEYLIKDAISDKKNIIKIEYQLNNEIKSLRQELDKILAKNNFTVDVEFKIPLLISDIEFHPSKKCVIPIKTLCLQKDDLWAKDISDIKIDSEKLEKLYIEFLNNQNEILSNQSKLEIFQSYFQKQKRSSTNLFLNAGLYNAFTRKFLSTIQLKETKETVSDTLIGVMVNKKAKIYTRSYIYLSLPIILLVLGSILTDIKIEPFLIYANIFFLASTLINQKILEFRIAKGYYGSNEYEAREMLRFVADNSDGSNFSGGTGLKPFPAEDMPKSIWVEGCVTV